MTWIATIGIAMGFGIITATKNIATGVATVICSSALIAWLASAPLGAGLTLGCAGSAAIAFITTAAYQGVHSGGGDIVGKRDLGDIEVGGFQFSDAVLLTNSSIIGVDVDLSAQHSQHAQALAAVGVDYLHVVRHMSIESSNSTSNFRKRDDNDGIVSLVTSRGDITSISSGALSIDKMVQNIVDELSNKTTQLSQKRDEYYIDWATYNFNNVNHDLIVKFRDQVVNIGRYEKNDHWTLDNDMGQKLCLSAALCPHLERGCSPQEVVENNAFHGELYWNAYGGIDGFCDANDDDTGF